MTARFLLLVLSRNDVADSAARVIARTEGFGRRFFWREPPPAEPRGEASWRVQIEYSDETAQEIVSYQYCLEDQPEELYLALLEYFEPEEYEFSEYFERIRHWSKDAI